MIDDGREPEPRLGDREGFSEWMGQIMDELAERQGGEGAPPAPEEPSPPAPAAGPAGDGGRGRPRMRLLRRILR